MHFFMFISEHRPAQTGVDRFNFSKEPFYSRNFFFFAKFIMKFLYKKLNILDKNK